MFCHKKFYDEIIFILLVHNIYIVRMLLIKQKCLIKKNLASVAT